MQFEYKNTRIEIEFEYVKENVWIPVKEAQGDAYSGIHFSDYDNQGTYSLVLEKRDKRLFYRVSFEAKYPTALRFKLRLAENSGEAFHVIPCNIFGNNNEPFVVPGEFPLLTNNNNRYFFCSPKWEFRADRAAMPISAICTGQGVLGLSVEPYSGDIHNGLMSELPDYIGVSLGYTNYPCTATCKRIPTPSTYDRANKAETSGYIYFFEGSDRRLIHEIVRMEYEDRHEEPCYKQTYEEAARGLLEAFVKVNWNKEEGEYTNVKCKPPLDMELKPWRNVVEIGWTGGGVLAYPLVLTREVLGNEADELLNEAMSGEKIIDRITDSFNEQSGLYNDIMTPIDGSNVNGWWSGFGLTKDCHCSYTNGSALHYILKTIRYLKLKGKPYDKRWLETALKVMDTVISLQREDGNYGYTYSVEKPKVLDWDGFAGCWFAAAGAYCYELTHDEKYLESVDKALDYYYKDVRNLCCSGTPMDTWKSVDEEGNLSFIRASRIMHELTGKDKYLGYLKDGADYEFLWRYGYKTRPDFAPLKKEYSDWNSCGGSVTSVSNPHIHPMGAIVNEDILYLGNSLNDEYYRLRGQDGITWLMQTLELYPEKTGYGRYGVLSERWCPSDGLTVERYSDGRPYSSWFSYNLWAAADALENVCESFLRENGE